MMRISMMMDRFLILSGFQGGLQGTIRNQEWPVWVWFYVVSRILQAIGSDP